MAPDLSGCGGRRALHGPAWMQGEEMGPKQVSHYREAVCHSDTNGRSLRVEIGYGGAGRKVEATGAKVGNASVGRRKVGEITASWSGKSKIIIIVKQIIRTAIHNIGHPPHQVSQPVSFMDPPKVFAAITSILWPDAL